MTNKEHEEELTELMSVRRLEVSQRIKWARNNGKPLYDNPEYDAAKEEQRIVENRIDEIRNILRAKED